MTLSNPAQYISGRTVQEQMNSLIDYVDQRAADVALNAIASDVAQVHQDMLDADADAAAAAASAAAAAGTLANAVKKTGESSQSIAGDIAVAGALSGGSISTSGAATFSGTTTVPAPVNNTDAATKKYVDDADALKINITAINTYAVGLTGNQTASGIKSFSSSLIQTGSACPTMRPGNDPKLTTPTSNISHNMVLIQDDSTNNLAGLFATTGTDGKRHITAYVFDCDGTYRSQVIL